MESTIIKRQNKKKKCLLELLVKTPIVQFACDKSGVGRATYYRWRKDSKEFTKLSDQALKEGNLLINDMSEAQLLSLIKDKNITAIIFWLKHHHPAYTQKIEFSTQNREIISDEDITRLNNFLSDINTFKYGQELLTSYVIKGFITEKLAHLILKMVTSKLKIEDVMTRKEEANIMSEVMIRNLEKKQKDKFKHGLK